MKTAVVTGASSGIGYWTSRYLSVSGFCVYGLSRHGEDKDGIKHIDCDVTDEKSVLEAIAGIISETGRIDLVVNCAGFGISGAAEFTETPDAVRLFDVNFFGTVRVNKACFEALREAKGRIINISSVAAPAPIPFQTYYSASKAAINSYSMAIANELKPFGVSVCAVLPGDTKTGFTRAREKSAEGDDIYGGRISRSVSRMEKDEMNGMSAEAAGKYIAKIALRRHVRPLYTIGLQYKAVTALLKILPVSLSNRILGAMYAS